MPDQPITQTMKASEARQQFSSVLNRVFRKETRVVVERSGIPIAAIVSAEDLKRLDQLEKEQEDDFRTLAAIGERFKDVPVEELEQEVARALSEARSKRTPS